MRVKKQAEQEQKKKVAKACQGVIILTDSVINQIKEYSDHITDLPLFSE